MTYITPGFLRAVQHIDRWYRYGDREICVILPMFRAYVSGISPAVRFTATEPLPRDPFGRVYLAYKDARVFTAEGVA